MVRSKKQAVIEEYDALLTMVKKRKLRSSGLAKTILQGTVNEKKKTDEVANEEVKRQY